MDLSVVIPARNEAYLKQTVEDVLSHREAKTEVIIICDGQWPIEPIDDHPDVHMVYHPASVGQRAATNHGAKISTARYLMKLDAHCGVSQGFDRVLIESAEQLGSDVTQIPRMFNHHTFDWQCRACGNRTYQGPTLHVCEKCKKSQGFTKIMVWKKRDHKMTEFWRFDHTLHFQYWSSYRDRPEAKGDIVDVMTSIGACFFIERARFLKLGGFDERAGSWGQYGVELACKSMLSGGRHVVNKRAWFSHMFRTQGGDFGFPYELKGSQVDQARKHSRETWFGNTFKHQVRPLEWIIDKFWPIPGWSDPEGREALDLVRAAGKTFQKRSSLTLPSVVTGKTPTIGALRSDGVGSNRQQVAALTVGLPRVDSGPGTTAHEVLPQRDQDQMGRVTASGIAADDMVELGNVTTDAHGQGADQPRIHESVDEDRRVRAALSWSADQTVASGPGGGAGPEPAGSRGVDSDLREESTNRPRIEVTGNREKLAVSHSEPPSQATSRSGPGTAETVLGPHILSKRPRAGYAYYSDCRGDESTLQLVRDQLKRCAEAHGHKIVSVTLAPVELGFNRVLPLERGVLTMTRQILAAIEALDTETVFLCEHDVLYHPSHFEFVPPQRDVFYYNEHVYKVDCKTGQALFYYVRQTSGLCADRALLIEHYRTRVVQMEQVGFTRRNGFEPGTRQLRHGGYDDHRAEGWMSQAPNVDLRTGFNLTPSRFQREQFRNQRYTRGWTLCDEIPAWGRTKDRVSEFLDDVRRGDAPHLVDKVQTKA